MELLVGCGSNLAKKIVAPGQSKEWDCLVTLDINPAHKPDVVHDLANIPLPFADSTFDSCHAYDTLEHVGAQGDYRFFFAQWQDFWRILKPGGLFCGISPLPNSKWAFGDPGHTRVFCPELLIFLSQDEYQKQVGVTAMTDYRFCYSADFKILHVETTQDGRFWWVMEALKSRVRLPEAGDA